MSTVTQSFGALPHLDTSLKNQEEGPKLSLCGISKTQVKHFKGKGSNLTNTYNSKFGQTNDTLITEFKLDCLH